jgi:hypothetical protein
MPGKISPFPQLTPFINLYDEPDAYGALMVALTFAEVLTHARRTKKGGR